MKYLIFLFLLFLTAELFSQPFQLKGKILNQENIEVSFVAVILLNSAKGTVSDEEGNFILNLNHFNDTLVFSSLRYEKLSISLQK